MFLAALNMQVSVHIRVTPQFKASVLSTFGEENPSKNSIIVQKWQQGITAGGLEGLQSFHPPHPLFLQSSHGQSPSHQSPQRNSKSLERSSGVSQA